MAMMTREQHAAESQPPDTAETPGQCGQRDDAHRLPHCRGIALDILEGLGIQLQGPTTRSANVMCPPTTKPRSRRLSVFTHEANPQIPTPTPLIYSLGSFVKKTPPLVFPPLPLLLSLSS